MKKHLVSRVVLMALLAVMVMIVPLLQVKSAAAGTTEYVYLYVYRAASVPTSYTDATLKGYVNDAMQIIANAVKSADSSITVDWDTYGVYQRTWSGCDTVSKAVGERKYRQVAVNFYYKQLGHNGYATQGSSSTYAMIDLKPTLESGCPAKTCAGTKVCDWPNLSVVTHELGHVFNADHQSCGEELLSVYNDADDLCGKSCGSICWGKSCVMQYANAGAGTTSFCSKDATKLKDYFKNVWP